MSLTHIQTITAGTPGISTIDFTNIPQNFTDLQVVLTMRSNRSAGVEACKLQFNGSTSGYVDRCLLGFSNNTGYSETNTNLQYGMFYFGNGDTTISGAYSSASIYIPNYTASTNKRVSIDGAFEDNNASAWQGIAAVTWSNSQAINRLTVSPLFGTTWLNQTTASLYGVDKTTPTGSGATPNVEYLVVAGGGGGGGYVGGGGGAGGLLTGPSLAVTSGSAITVTVGAGGAGAPSAGAARGSNGSSSTLLSISPIGGGGGSVGGGGSTNIGPGQNGGSGGGGGSSTGNLVGGSGTAGQGYAGGSSSGMGGDYGSGGGGGYASIGETPTAGTGGGDGGSGTSSTITGAMAYYSGGGGGANGNAYGASIPGNGGIGGGGRGTLHNMADGQVVTAGTPGVANTGGGAGGGGVAVNSQAQGMQGGSGVVIIRYPDNYANPTATTGNPVVNYANGYKIYTWTASGSITF